MSNVESGPSYSTATGEFIDTSFNSLRNCAAGAGGIALCFAVEISPAYYIDAARLFTISAGVEILKRSLIKLDNYLYERNLPEQLMDS